MSATTTAVTWLAGHFVFRGVVPDQVVGVIQYGIPLGLSALAAEIRWRVARARQECTSSGNG